MICGRTIYTYLATKVDLRANLLEAWIYYISMDLEETGLYHTTLIYLFNQLIFEANMMPMKEATPNMSVTT